jgi:hypothetical protein
MARATTMKISEQTRDRLRALQWDGSSLEDVVVAALDDYEARAFWSVAEASAAAETTEQRRRRRRIEDDIDAWMDGLR